MHVYTLRAENQFLPADFRSGADAAARGDLAGEATAFLGAGVDGYFTDYPELGVKARDLFLRHGPDPVRTPRLALRWPYHRVGGSHGRMRTRFVLGLALVVPLGPACTEEHVTEATQPLSIHCSATPSAGMAPLSVAFGLDVANALGNVVGGDQLRRRPQRASTRRAPRLHQRRRLTWPR